MELEQILAQLKRHRFSLSTEAVLKTEMAPLLPGFIPEYRLDEKSRPDFFREDGIAIEVKIKGSPKAIYKQCLRYCESDKVKTFILITNRSMGFPDQILGKPCYVVNIGRGWL
jgi:hypothetical protein